MKYYSEQNPDKTMRSTQSSFFNRQTQANVVVQPKLTVGASNDAHEREADQTADRVMRKSEGTPMASMTPIAAIQRKCEQCEKEEKVNRKETGTSGGFTAPPSVSRAISRSGQALEPAAKSFMETRFNRKFDGVQVHTDGEAANSARDISAKAYTSGNHIVFGEGQYQPNTEGGRHLLAHELTHVVQQNGGAMQEIQRDKTGKSQEPISPKKKPEPPKKKIVVDLTTQKATLFEGDKEVKSMQVSTGKKGHETTTSTHAKPFTIGEKDKNHASSTYGKCVDAKGVKQSDSSNGAKGCGKGLKYVGAPMPFFQRFNGGEGFHVGKVDADGHDSHGCVRLNEGDAKFLWDWTHSKKGSVEVVVNPEKEKK